MSQRTWVCLPCGKSYRRRQDVQTVLCPTCGEECECVHWKIRIPSPKKAKLWNEFWKQYRAEKALLNAHKRGALHESVELKLLNIVLHVG
jgi:DNA-directed RNA polymerase subunit RPC12/RpoP